MWAFYSKSLIILSIFNDFINFQSYKEKLSIHYRTTLVDIFPTKFYAKVFYPIHSKSSTLTSNGRISILSNHWTLIDSWIITLFVLTSSYSFKPPRYSIKPCTSLHPMDDLISLKSGWSWNWRNLIKSWTIFWHSLKCLGLWCKVKVGNSKYAKILTQFKHLLRV